MNKLKKYVYPLAFIISSFIYLFVSASIAHIFFNSDWSALGALLIAVAIWLLIIVPIYCVKYSKIIQGEQFKVLFAAYNTFVIVGSYILPFIQGSEAYGYGVVLFVWVLFWSVLFLQLRTRSCEDEENLSKEEMHITAFLLQNKKKTIIVICLTCLYIITLATDSMVWQFHSISSVLIYTLPLFSAFLFLVFLFSKNIDYSLKKWLLPIALAGEFVSGLFSICSSLSSMDVLLKYIPMYPITFIFSCLMVILIAIMFTGTLLNFKYIKLLKYGALGHAILSVGRLLFELINVGGTLAVNTALVINLLLRALYFIGIFILTTNKRNTYLV